MPRLFGTTIALGLAASLAGCGKEPQQSSAVQRRIPAARAAHSPRTTLTDLHWIIGSFRGAGAWGTVQEPFFERYSLANDSALVVESFKDSAFGGVPDSTRYHLRGDSLTNDEAAATSVSPGSVTFSSRKNSGLAWTWRRDDDSAWTAVIVNSVPNGPPTSRVYRMVRLK